MMRTCPICGRQYGEYPALSRVDNKTEICPDCGLDEALACFLKKVRLYKRNRNCYNEARKYGEVDAL